MLLPVPYTLMETWARWLGGTWPGAGVQTFAVALWGACCCLCPTSSQVTNKLIGKLASQVHSSSHVAGQHKCARKSMCRREIVFTAPYTNEGKVAT